nr:hypothetical protein [Tanacetum cinerariifolium]
KQQQGPVAHPIGSLGIDALHHALEIGQGKRGGLLLLNAFLAADAFEQGLELPVVGGRRQASQLVGLAHGGTVALDGGHLFAGFGQRRDKGRHRR